MATTESSISALPAPLVPPEVDLRGMPTMPVDIAELFNSEFFALSSAEIFKIGVILRFKSWSQIPASSLPSDDRILARLAGVTPRRWAKVKDTALLGFTLCSDGRFYNSTIAEKALIAWQHRQAQREKARARWQEKSDAAGHAPAYAAGHAEAMPDKQQGSQQVPNSNSSSNGNRAAAVAVLLRHFENARGKAPKITSADPRVVAWADAGVTDEQLREAHALAVSDREAKGDPMPINAGFLDVFVRKLLNPGTAPARAVTPASIDWYRTDTGWQSKARELGIVEADFLRLRARVCVALGSGPWVDSRNATLQRLINEIQEAA